MRRPLSLLLLAVLFVACSSHGPKPGMPVAESHRAPRLASAAQLHTDPVAVCEAIAADPVAAAWDLFIELNEPVAAAGTKVWETEFRQTSTVYLADGGAPPAWGQDVPPADLDPIPPAPPGCEGASPEVRHNLDTTIQVDGRDLLDKWNQPVRYQLLMNEPTFNYIVSRQFYNVNGQELAAQRNEPANFPADSYELKTSWLWLGTDAAKCAELKDNYYVVNAYYQKFDRDGQPAGWDSRLCRPRRHAHHQQVPGGMGLDHFRERRQQPVHGRRGWSCPSRPRPRPRTSPTRAPCRARARSSPTISWTACRPSSPRTTGQPTLLANSTIESAFQTQSSCITCHALASIKPNGELFQPRLHTGR